MKPSCPLRKSRPYARGIIKERMELDVDVARLRIMKTDYQSKKFRLEDDILKRFPSEISKNEAMIAGIRADMQTLAAHPHPKDGFAGMTIHGHTYTEKGDAGGALLDACRGVVVNDGQYHAHAPFRTYLSYFK